MAWRLVWKEAPKPLPIFRVLKAVRLGLNIPGQTKKDDAILMLLDEIERLQQEIIRHERLF